MLSVLLLIAIGFTIAGFVIYANCCSDNWFGAGVFGTFCSVILLITVCIMLGFIASASRIDMKIAMYEEENTRIEQSVISAVEKYLDHEQSIFEDISNEDLQTLLIVYPEIKADTLITKQIEVFIENNAKIKELKEEKISLGTLRFLVYFGY